MCGCNKPRNVKTFTSGGVKFRTQSSAAGKGTVPAGNNTPTVIRQQNVVRQLTDNKMAERKTKLAEVRKKIIQKKFR